MAKSTTTSITTEQPKELIEYGEAFLNKTIETLLFDVDFFLNIKNLLLPKYFEGSKPHQFLLEKMYEHFKDHNIPPTINELYTYNSLQSDAILKEFCKTILDNIRSNFDCGYDTQYYEFYRNHIKNYCTRQLYTYVIKDKFIPMLQQNKFDDIGLLFHETTRLIDFDTNVYDYEGQFEHRIKPENRNAISTGWSCIDDIMEGGLAAGEVAYIMGELGAGKSWLLTQIVINALKSGKNVLHISLENRKRTVGLRYDSLITGTNSKRLYEFQDVSKQKITDFFKTSGKLFIQEFPTNGMNIAEMYSYIKRVQNKYKTKIDLLILDYIDIIDLSKYEGQEWYQVKKATEDLRKIAFDLNIGVWTATHPNAEGIKAQIMKYSQVAGGTNRFKVVDFVFSFNRDLDSDSTEAILYCGKNRIGQVGGMFKMIFDINNAYIKVIDKIVKNETPTFTASGNNNPDRLLNLMKQIESMTNTELTDFDIANMQSRQNNALQLKN